MFGSILQIVVVVLLILAMKPFWMQENVIHDMRVYKVIVTI